MISSLRLALLSACILLGACREPNGLPGQVVAARAAADVQPAVSVGSPARVDAPPIGETAASKMCNLEFIDGEAFGTEAIAVRGGFRVRGWLGVEDGAVPASSALMFAKTGEDAVFRVPVALAVPRPDVAQAFPGVGGLENSGFYVEVDVDAMPPGRFHVYLGYETPSGPRVCDNGRHLQISPR